MAIRLAVVVADPGLADSLAAASGELEIVGTATMLADAATLLGKADSDVALVDAWLPDGAGFGLVAAAVNRGRPSSIVRSPGTMYDLDAALRSGAVGFVLDTTPIPEIVALVRDVASGRTAFLTEPLHQAGEPLRLTSREHDLLLLLLSSQSNEEIGRALGLATKSVETYLSRLYARVGVRSRLELALRAEREGWLGPR